MNCLRCGADVPEGESFCEKCLEYMKSYPVPKDIHVMIPKPVAAVRRSSGWKQTLSADEKFAIVNRRLKKARIVIAILLLLVAGLCGLTAWLFMREQGPALGQNYSTVSPTAPSGTLPTEVQ